MAFAPMGVVLFLSIVSATWNIAVAAPVPRNLVSNVLGSNMILQRAPQRAVIWGFTNQTFAVNVKLFDNKTSVVVDQGTVFASATDGLWVYTFPPMEADLRSYTITVTGNFKGATLTNVYFGDVYACHGQSNMQLGLSTMDTGDADLADVYNYPNIRIFKVDRNTQNQDFPYPEWPYINTPWTSPSNKTATGFSAVCWYFAKNLYRGLGGVVPIGVVHAAVAGKIECYMPPQDQPTCAVYGLRPCDKPAETTVNVSNLWNTNFHPMLRLRHRGFILMKGEGELGFESMWACVVNTMINKFRLYWNIPAELFGFYWVQTHPFQEYGDKILGFGRLRAAQSGPVLWNENVGLATAVDGGDPPHNIHPLRGKDLIGQRLALTALAKNYHLPVVYKGPNITDYHVLSYQPLSGTSRTVTIALVIEGDSMGSGLELRIVPNISTCSPLLRWDLCAPWEVQMSNGLWYPGDIQLPEDGGFAANVVASVPLDVEVIGLRFGYGPFPLIKLYNKEGIPAMPFWINATQGRLPSYTTAAGPVETSGTTGTTSTGTTGTTSTGTTSSGTTSTGSTGTTSTGTIGPASTGTTSTGTTSTGTTSTGTSAAGTTAAPAPVAIARYAQNIWQDAGANGWNYGFGSTTAGTAVPLSVFRDPLLTLKGKNDDKLVRALVPPGQSSTFFYMSASNVSNVVPAGATVVGLRIYVWRRASSVGLRDAFFGLSVAGAVQPASNQCPAGSGSMSCTWSATYPIGAVPSFGSPTSTWGVALTPQMVNALEFGVAVQVTNTASEPIEAFIDQMQFEVRYIVGPAAPLTTSTGTTSTGTTSTGTTSTGTTSTGVAAAISTTTAAPAVPGTTSGTTSTVGCDSYLDLAGQEGQMVYNSHLTRQVAPLTVSFWIYSLEPHPREQSIVGNGAYNVNGWVIQILEGNYIGVTMANVTDVASTYQLPLREWRFISAVTTALNVWSIYDSGVLSAQVVVPGPNPTKLPAGKFFVGGHGGRYNGAGNGNLDAYVDAVQLWLVARTPAQLVEDAALSWQNELTGFEPGLIMYLPFNEGDGNTTMPVGNGTSRGAFSNSGVVRWGFRNCPAGSTTTSTGVASTGSTQAVEVHTTGTTQAVAPQTTGTTVAPPAEICMNYAELSKYGALVYNLPLTFQSQPLTFSAWIYLKSLSVPDHQTVFWNGQFMGNGQGLVIRQSGVVAIGVNAAFWNGVYSPPLNTWIFLSAVTAAENVWSVYVNAVLVDTIVVGGAAPIRPNGKFVLGGHGGSHNAPDNGNLDARLHRVMYWTVARSAEQLASDMTFDAITGFELGLKAFAPLGEGAGVNSTTVGTTRYELYGRGTFSWGRRCESVAAVSTTTSTTTSTSSTATTSTGTTSTGTTSTGTTSTGTTSTGSTAAAAGSSSTSTSTGTTGTTAAADGACAIPDYGGDFSGASGFLQLTNGAATSLVKGNTLCAWVFLNSVPSGQDRVVFHNGNPMTNGQGIVVQGGSGAARVGVRYGAVGSFFGTYELPLREWHYVCVVSPSLNQWMVYIDGDHVQNITATGTPLAPGGKFVLAGNGVDSAANFDGIIDEVSVWRSAFSRASVARMMEPGVVLGTEPSCAAFVPFAEGTGTSTTPGGALSARGAFSVSGTFQWAVRLCRPTLAKRGVAEVVGELARETGSEAAGNVEHSFVTAAVVGAIVLLLVVVAAVAARGMVRKGLQRSTTGASFDPEQVGAPPKHLRRRKSIAPEGDA